MKNKKITKKITKCVTTLRRKPREAYRNSPALEPVTIACVDCGEIRRVPRYLAHTVKRCTLCQYQFRLKQMRKSTKERRIQEHKAYEKQQKKPSRKS